MSWPGRPITCVKGINHLWGKVGELKCNKQLCSRVMESGVWARKDVVGNISTNKGNKFLFLVIIFMKGYIISDRIYIRSDRI